MFYISGSYYTGRDSKVGIWSAPKPRGSKIVSDPCLITLPTGIKNIIPVTHYRDGDDEISVTPEEGEYLLFFNALRRDEYRSFPDRLYRSFPFSSYHALQVRLWNIVDIAIKHLWQ